MGPGLERHAQSLVPMLWGRMDPHGAEPRAAQQQVVVVELLPEQGTHARRLQLLMQGANDALSVPPSDAPVADDLLRPADAPGDLVQERAQRRGIVTGRRPRHTPARTSRRDSPR